MNDTRHSRSRTPLCAVNVPDVTANRADHLGRRTLDVNHLVMSLFLHVARDDPRVVIVGLVGHTQTVARSIVGTRGRVFAVAVPLLRRRLVLRSSIEGANLSQWSIRFEAARQISRTFSDRIGVVAGKRVAAPTSSVRLVRNSRLGFVAALATNQRAGPVGVFGRRLPFGGCISGGARRLLLASDAGAGQMAAREREEL
jgi:hypothetical protein